MIRINLLPMEFRRGRRVSTRLLAVAFGSVLAVCASIGWFGLTYFGKLGEVEEAHAALKTRLEQKQKRAAYYDKLDANQKDYQNRVNTIQAIGRSRRLWSKFLDQLVEVINNDSDVDRHIAWFRSMVVKSDPKKGATVTMPGAVQGKDFGKVSNLLESIRNAPFFPELQEMPAPQGKQEISPDRTPPESIEFPMQLTFKPTAPSAKPKPGAPKPAAPRK